MNARRWFAWIPLALVSAAAGWMLDEWQHAERASSSAPASAPLVRSAETARAVSVFSYPQAPADAGQAPARGAPGPSLAEAACPPQPAAAGAEERARLLSAIGEGNEEARYEGLLKARSAGTVVPDLLLQTLFENDTSERVRLLAFENYLEPRSGNNEEMRRTLLAALDIPSAAIQADARRRLAQLSELESNDAAHPQVTQ